MLDAAHGESVGALVGTQRVRTARMEVEVPRVVRVGCAVVVRRRRPVQSLVTDTSNDSRLRVAEARSRALVAIAQWECRKERILMNN